MNARIIKNKERLKNTKVAEQYTTTVIIIINNNNYVYSDDDCARTKTRQRVDHPKGRPKDLWRPKGRPRKVTRNLCVRLLSCLSRAIRAGHPKNDSSLENFHFCASLCALTRLLLSHY